MDKTFRYLHLLQHGRFGLSLPRGSLTNYLNIRRGHITETVGGTSSSFPIVSIFAAMRCNLKCSFCVCAPYFKDWREYEMTPDVLRRILDFDAVKRSLMIVFTGGEPTLNKDIAELIGLTRRRKHLVGMITNGVLMENMAGDCAKAGLCDVQLSIYDTTKDMLGAILPRITPLFPVHASYVLLKSKLHDSQKDVFSPIIEIIRMAKESGCSSLKFNLCQSVAGRPGTGETVTGPDDAYDRMIEQCKQRLKDVHFTGYKGKGGLPSPKFTVFFPAPVPGFGNRTTGERKCRLPWNLGTFGANGSYGFCCGAKIDPGLNAFENCEAVINSGDARRIRKCLIDMNEPLAPECAKCVYLEGSYISDL
jgi:organic radical activating enzyme